MANLQAILDLPRGAQFYRGDLHIHSVGASHDVQDVLMTPQAIVTTAVQEGLSLIAVTDHNEISNVSAAIDAAASLALLVVPGVELSTQQGHLLCYLPTLEALNQFFGRLEIADKGTGNSRCQNSMFDCLEKLTPFRGFAILAHVDAPKGLEKELPGSNPHTLDILCHPNLLGIELRAPDSTISYSDTDDEVRRSIGAQRISRLGLGSRQYLARVLFSDSHGLSALGRNAAGARKVTRFKMQNPDFNSLRIALEDSDARVRIEDLIPPTVPHVRGVSFEGGFLNGQSIHFSKNLNCIIGGRGTGKSLTFHAIRFLSEERSSDGVVDSDVWPAELSLFWSDKADAVRSLRKYTGDPIVNLDNPDNGPTSFELDCYGQSETAKLSQKAQSDPLALLEYLDRFIDPSAQIAEENAARDDILALQTEIEKAEIEVGKIPQYERFLATVRDQLKASEKENATEIIKLQRQLADERAVRDAMLLRWEEAKANISPSKVKEKLKLVREASTADKISVGNTEFEAIVQGANEFEGKIDNLSAGLAKGSAEFDAIIKAKIAEWRAKDLKEQGDIEVKRKALEESGVRLDMGFIQKLATDEAQYKQNLANLRTWEPHLKELKRNRAAALKKRWTARDKTAAIRSAYARRASNILRETLGDLQVSLKFVESGAAPEAASQIQQAMQWKTNQVPRAALLIEKLTLPKLLDAITTCDIKSITPLQFEDGTRPFNTTDARLLLERLGESTVRYAPERSEVHDLPQLQVTRQVVRQDGTTQFVTRDFSKLSLGQQQSILLSLLLSSDSTDPLVIDQPEDNLDSEFIYSSFVPVLRRAKERRQIIIITHNANIAVLGDAEQIVVLKSFNDRSQVTARGSIDSGDTREASCNILEGAKEAFKKRAKIYGVI